MTRATTAALLAGGLLLGAGAFPATAQDLAEPLTVQGTHQRSVHSATSAAMGGLTLIGRDNAASMLQNPATLASISGLQVTLGGVYRSIDRRQIQHYAPVRYYPNLSLLLEGLADQIPDPDPNLIGFTPADSVQRSFDDISPNWSTDNRGGAPLQGFVAVPVTTGDVRFAAGFGVVEYGDFDYYYQNNNVITPNVLSQRPLPAPRPTDDNPVQVDWYQAVRSRQGSVTGYGGALAMEWARHGLAFGVSGTYLSGSTTDFEQDVARGQLTFFANYFRADSAQGQITRTGHSDFSGLDLAISTTLSSRFVTAGVTVRPPLVLTRAYQMNVSGGPASSISGEDELRLPWRGNIGLGLHPREELAFGLEYELRPLGSARFTDASGNEQSPWMSSSAFRVGAEYHLLPWLAVRAGMRREAETFGAEGRPVEDQPVWYTAYTTGAGIAYAGLELNFAYEHRGSRYQDIFGSAVHHNRDNRQAFVADLVYRFDWGL